MVTEYDIGDVVYFVEQGEIPHKGTVSGIYVRKEGEGLYVNYDVDECGGDVYEVNSCDMYKDKDTMVAVIEAAQQIRLKELAKRAEQDLKVLVDRMED